MLKKLPEVGEFVMALRDDEWEGGCRYQTKGEVYKIVGISDISGAPYFIGDLDDPIYIDEEAFDLYKLIEHETKEVLPTRNVNIGVVGVEVNAWNYIEDATDFSIKFKMFGDSRNTLKAIDSLQEDIVKLLEDKYQ